MATTATIPQLIIGLKNPGDKYENTRHNIGGAIVASFCQSELLSFSKHSSGAKVATLQTGQSEKIIFGSLGCYMNESGDQVQKLQTYYKIPPERILIIHDELDLEFGVLELKYSGGHAGHNGLRDIIAKLGTNDFIRLRVGIGRPKYEMDVAKFVLQKYSKIEQNQITDQIITATNVISSCLTIGWQQTQQKLAQNLI